jgi:hypothetical protein
VIENAADVIIAVVTLPFLIIIDGIILGLHLLMDEINDK